MSTGRRNCKRCTRWKLDTEFKWRWERKPGPSGKRGRPNPRYDRPVISNICRSCERELQRERYAAMSPEKKRDVGNRSNRRAVERRALLIEQIERTRMIHERTDPQWDDKRVDLVPFRMWILGQIRLSGGMQQLARRMGMSEKNIRRWADGYDWDTNGDRGWGLCEPRPIFTINVVTVDEAGVAMDDPGLLDRLYPFIDPST